MCIGECVHKPGKLPFNMEYASKPSTVPSRIPITIDGILWPNLVTVATLNAVKNFHIREDDVWVLSYPKSGMFVMVT